MKYLRIGYCQKLSGRVGYRVPVRHCSWERFFSQRCFVGISYHSPFLEDSVESVENLRIAHLTWGELCEMPWVAHNRLLRNTLSYFSGLRDIRFADLEWNRRCVQIYLRDKFQFFWIYEAAWSRKMIIVETRIFRIQEGSNPIHQEAKRIGATR